MGWYRCGFEGSDMILEWFWVSDCVYDRLVGFYGYVRKCLEEIGVKVWYMGFLFLFVIVGVCVFWLCG